MSEIDGPMNIFETHEKLFRALYSLRVDPALRTREDTRLNRQLVYPIKRNRECFAAFHTAPSQFSEVVMGSHRQAFIFVAFPPEAVFLHFLSSLDQSRKKSKKSLNIIGPIRRRRTTTGTLYPFCQNTRSEGAFSKEEARSASSANKMSFFREHGNPYLNESES